MSLATYDVYIKAVVWDILIEECDATPTAVAFADFAASWPECREYRFMGIFGMGGKVHWNDGHAYVTCYREEESPKRLAARDVANERLMKLAVPSASDAPGANPIRCGRPEPHTPHNVTGSSWCHGGAPADTTGKDES